MLLAMALVGCEQAEPIQLVPIAGCGLDQTFSGLRVRVLGDFPPTSTTELLLGNGETRTIDSLPADATGIAAEGVFGMTITAIGRGYGIDPERFRGRIAGSEGPLLPIWFAAPDSMCAVEATIPPHGGFAWAEAPSGDVLIVGGRDASGVREDLIHYDVLANTTRTHTLTAGSATGRVGHSVHGLDDGRFVALGGARSGEVLEDALFITGVADVPQLESASIGMTLAHHAAAESTRGRVLVAGGCDQVDMLGECSAQVHARAAWIELGESPTSEVLPELGSARANAHAFVSSDGVVFVAGGFDEAGVGLGSVERLLPGADGWETIVEFEVDALAGLTVLEGGLVIVADVDGELHWWSTGGSGVLDASLRAPMLAPALGSRALLSLPGERVLVDTWLFAPGSAAIDPSAEIVDLVGKVSGESPARIGGAVLLLRDGSVLLGGGTATGADPLPFLARVRPQLDGPDEQVPELASPRSDAFVSNTPAAAMVLVGGLRLTGVAGSLDEQLPRVHVHVRGFRSRSFRLEFELGAEQGNAGVLMVGQGAAHALTIELSPSAVVVRLHESGGEILELDCAGERFEAELPAVLEVGEAGSRVRVLQADRVVADCSLAALDPWPDLGGLYVGLGVVGPGDRTFRSLRLARL